MERLHSCKEEEKLTQSSKTQKYRGPRIEVQKEKVTTREKLIASKLSGFFEILLTTKSHLHVGGEEFKPDFPKEYYKKVRQSESVVADFDKLTAEAPPSRKDIKGLYKIKSRVAIPGRTLKGLARKNIELTLKPINNIVPSCFIISDSYYQRNKVQKHKAYYYTPLSKEITIRNKCRPLKIKPFYDLTRNEVCTTCQLFGTMGLRSLISFEPAIIAQPDPSQIITVKHEHGGHIELIVPNQTFFTKATFLNLSAAELGLLIYIGLRFQRQQLLRIGFRKYSSLFFKEQQKSIQMGRVSVSISKLVVNNNPYSENELQEYLNQKILPKMTKKYGRFLPDTLVKERGFKND